MSQVLNDFQIGTKDKIEKIFSAEGAKAPVFDVLGVKEVRLYTILPEKGIEIFIYDDGAQFFGEKVDRRFEAPDYDTLDEMSNDFVKTLDNFLFHPERYIEPRTIFRMIKEFFQRKSNK